MRLIHSTRDTTLGNGGRGDYGGTRKLDVNADEKDENELTGKLGRMPSACEKCTKLS